MKHILLFAAFAVFTFSCSSNKVAVTPVTPTPEPVVVPAAPPASPDVVTADPSVQSSPESVAQGKQLYDNNCAKCHELFSPTDFKAEDWEPILKRMQRKAKLTDNDMLFIHEYVFSSL